MIAVNTMLIIVMPSKYQLSFLNFLTKIYQNWKVWSWVSPQIDFSRDGENVHFKNLKHLTVFWFIIYLLIDSKLAYIRRSWSSNTNWRAGQRMRQICIPIKIYANWNWLVMKIQFVGTTHATISINLS